MTLGVFTNSIPEEVGQLLGTALRDRFGDLSSPAKRLARRLGISEPTARSMFSGNLPATPTFLIALDMLGQKTAATIMERLVGRQDSNTARLSAMEASLKEFAQHVEEIRVANSAGFRSVLGFGDAASDRSRPVAPVPGADMVGEQGDGAGEAAPQCRSLALVETRLDGPPGHGEALRRHLSAKIVSLDAARLLAKADNLGRTGFAYRHPGEDWKVLVARENRLWTPSHDPRPITDYTGDVVALRRNLDEASRSPVPLFVSHAGAMVRDGKLMPFHSDVVRIGGKAGGAEFVVTDFVRCAA